jgi:ribosome-associated protein
MDKTNTKIDSTILAHTIIDGLQEIKAKQITKVDLREVDSAVCDYFIICHGDSNTHVNGISSTVERYVKTEIKERPWHREGKDNAQWILLDYFDVVVHIFFNEARDFYRLEDLWADAKITQIESEE